MDPYLDTSHTSYSRRFTLENLDIRGQFVRLDDAWESLMQGRDLSPTAAKFLGEMACVSVLVGAGLKHAGRAILQIQRRADSPQKRGARLLVADCTHLLAIRGMVQSHDDSQTCGADLTFADWSAGCTLALTVANHETDQQYQSIVPISGLTVAECFEHYFDQSEQVPTHLWIAAGPRGGGALLLQKLPGADVKDPDGWARVEQLAASVRQEELLAAPIDDLLTKLFAEEDIRLFAPKPITSGCARDEGKVKNMLRSLGKAEVDAMIAELGEIVVNDDMCNQTYRFNAAEAAALFTDGTATAGGGPS